MPEETKQLKSGFVTLIGRSNVGKSTLLNALVGSKIAITTPKPQTTRRPVQGIVTTDKGQIVFVDTPGIMQKAKDSLTKKLTHFVKESLRDVDVVVYVADPTRDIGDEEKWTLRLIENIEVPKILVINKMDVRSPAYVDFYRDLSDRFDELIELSAKTGKNVNQLKQLIFEKLPFGEFLYPAHQISNMPTEEWVAELVREKLFLRLRQEVPYSTHVEVSEVTERDDGVIYIKGTIFTSEKRYKQMIIGQGGRGIREIGQSTRKELEGVLNTKVYLELNVEHNPHWHDTFQ